MQSIVGRDTWTNLQNETANTAAGKNPPRWIEFKVLNTEQRLAA